MHDCYLKSCVKTVYHINYGVMQKFPTLRKAVTTHMKKYHTVSPVFDITNQLLTRYLLFTSLGQG